jgi:hypothetical protein
MSMLKRLGRLFVIKTRFEAYVVTYAIAVGAIERGRHYLDIFPGTLGLLMAVLCTGVVFLAGAKLLDSVRPVAEPARKVSVGIPRRRAERAAISRNRPRRSPRSAAGSAASPRTS